MAKLYTMIVHEEDHTVHSYDIQLVSVPGFPEGLPSNNNAAIAKAQGWVDFHNANLMPHELPIHLVAVTTENTSVKVIWSKFID